MRRVLGIAAGLITATQSVHAHPQVVSGFIPNLIHIFTTLDHLLALITFFTLTIVLAYHKAWKRIAKVAFIAGIGVSVVVPAVSVAVLLSLVFGYVIQLMSRLYAAASHD